MIATHSATILIVTGIVTAGAAVVAVFPIQILKLVFGMEPADAPAKLISRHWGLLVSLVRFLLIYAGYHPQARFPIMIAAIVEKLAIGGLVLTSPLRGRLLAVIIVLADAAMALLYVAILGPA
ncbi:MAG: hypothetical protein WAK16_03760 [Candidatus Cybelea sp.]